MMMKIRELIGLNPKYPGYRIVNGRLYFCLMNGEVLA